MMSAIRSRIFVPVVILIVLFPVLSWALFSSASGWYVKRIDSRFVLAGRKDSFPIGGQGERRGSLELPERTEDLPVIVMDHQPGNIRDYGKETDLILCGHTHKGQMFPFNLITDAVFDVDYGYYRASVDSPQVIVTSGAGTWGPPQRVATDNDVAEILVMLAVRQ